MCCLRFIALVNNIMAAVSQMAQLKSWDTDSAKMVEWFVTAVQTSENPQRRDNLFNVVSWTDRYA